jgi:hypothetical protein
MLLERVSWLCRDHRKEGVGNGRQRSSSRTEGRCPMTISGTISTGSKQSLTR